MAGEVKLTKAQIAALELMRDIGSVHPGYFCGNYQTFAALERRGLVTRLGKSGPFAPTEAARAALTRSQP